MKFPPFLDKNGDASHCRSASTTVLRRFPVVALIAVAVSVVHIRSRELHASYSHQLDVLAFVLYGFLLYLGLLRPVVVRVATTRLAPIIDSFLGTLSGNRLSIDSLNVSRGIAFAVMIIIGLIVYLLAVDYLGHGKLEPGTFGDFFGGVLNPLLTFLTFVALAITMAMQRVQLRTALDDSVSATYQATLQRFESTFFNLIDLHNAIVRDLHFAPDDILFEHEKPDYDERFDGQGRCAKRWSLLCNEPEEVVGRRVFAAVLETMEDKVLGRNVYGIRQQSTGLSRLMFQHGFCVIGLCGLGCLILSFDRPGLWKNVFRVMSAMAVASMSMTWAARSNSEGHRGFSTVWA